MGSILLKELARLRSFRWVVLRILGSCGRADFPRPRQTVQGGRRCSLIADRSRPVIGRNPLGLTLRSPAVPAKYVAFPLARVVGPASLVRCLSSLARVVVQNNGVLWMRLSSKSGEFSQIYPTNPCHENIGWPYIQVGSLVFRH